MTIESYFFNAVQSGGVYDRTYQAEDFTSYLDLLVGNGVFPNPSTMLQVRASTGMNVIVGAGSGWINGHKLVNTADLTLTVEASDVVLDRIDAVIFYVDETERAMGIEVKKGTINASPVAPVMTRTSTRYEMCLATIYVKAQASAIITADITDTRMDSDVCGYVQGLIQQIDTSTLWEQQQNAFDQWFSDVQQQWISGKEFAKLEGTYTTVSSNEDEFDVTDYVPTYAYTADILEIYINGFHLNKDEYTQSGTVVTLVTPIELAGAVIDFVVYKLVPES